MEIEKYGKVVKKLKLEREDNVVEFDNLLDIMF